MNSVKNICVVNLSYTKNGLSFNLAIRFCYSNWAKYNTPLIVFK